MPKPLHARLAEALNVSGAFDNCFFHAYATHILANKLPLPEDLFTFKSILGADSPATQLQARFPNQDSLSLFVKYAQHHHPDEAPLFPNFIVEKTLVLGFLIREWFASRMSHSDGVANQIQAEIIKKFKIYRESRWDELEASTILSGSEGVLYTANKAFLEYFTVHPKDNLVTEEELRFYQYFTKANGDEDKALEAYWEAEGYQNYCQLIANPSTKLAYNDVVPVIEMLNQSLTIYNANHNQAIIHHHEGSDVFPKMEVKLDARAGHYYLLKTDETAPLLEEYQLSLEHYMKDRMDILSVVGDKDAAASTKPSLLVGAICPNGHLGKPPFSLLLDKVDQLKRFVQEQQKAEHVVNQYLEQIKALPVQFDTLRTADLIEKQKTELLKQLADMTRTEDFTQALKTLNITHQSPKVSEVISTKTQAINSAAQQQHTTVELQLKEEQQRLQQNKEQQLEKQREEQRQLRQAQQKAKQVVNQYVKQIKALPVQFGTLMTAELIEKQKTELLKQLADMTRTEDFTQALKTLNITHQSPKISEAISTKTQAINSAAQQQHTKVELLLKKEQQRLQQNKEQQLEKQREEQRQLRQAQQKAEQVVNQYVEHIKALPVQFDTLITVELIEKQKEELLKQLADITRTEDFTQALKTLTIEQPPIIKEAISRKIQAIDSGAHQQLEKVQFKLHEEQQQKQLEEQHQKQLKEQQLERQRQEQRQRLFKEQQERQVEEQRQLQLKEQEEQQRIQRQLEEQQRLPSEETRRHLQFITVEMSRIDNALNTLQQRISLVDQHHSTRAFNKATSLLQGLANVRDEYNTALNQPDVIIFQARTAFKEKCTVLIDDAKLLLENDLGWGDYLSNLLKTIVNAVIWMGSCGQKNSFFPLKRSESVVAIEEIEHRLELF